MRLPSCRKPFLLIALTLAIPALALSPVAARQGMVVSSDPLVTPAGLGHLQGRAEIETIFYSSGVAH